MVRKTKSGYPSKMAVPKSRSHRRAEGGYSTHLVGSEAFTETSAPSFPPLHSRTSRFLWPWKGGGCFIVGAPGVAQGFWGQGGFSDPPGHGRARALQGPSRVSGSGPGWPSGTGAPLSRAVGAVCQVSFSSPAPACAWPPGTHPAPHSDCSCTASAFAPCHRGNHGPLLSDQHYLYVQAEPGHDCSGESRKEGVLGLLLQRGWEVGCSLGMGQALADAPKSSYQPHCRALLRCSPRTAPLVAHTPPPWPGYRKTLEPLGGEGGLRGSSL